MPIGPDNVKAGLAVKKFRIIKTLADLSQTIGVFPADAPLPGEIVRSIQRYDVALLDEISGRIRDRACGRIGYRIGDLVRGRDIIEVRVFEQGVQSVVRHGPIAVAQDHFRVIAAEEGARAAAPRMVQLPEDARGVVYLILQVVLDKPAVPI